MSENASSRLARLLALVPWLRAHDGVTISEAAEHFQVTPDQLTTDLWQLIVCGIPGYGPDQLVDIQFWDDDRIHVLDPMTLDRPLRLTGEEAAALLVAVRVLGQIPGEHDRAALRSALSKLEMASVLTPDVDVRIDGDPSIVAVVSDALAQSAGVQIEYASASADSSSVRVIAPRASFTVDGYAYVEAWCDLAQGIRTFRLDRIASATLVPAPMATGSVTNDQREVITSLVPPDAPSARIAVDPDAAWIWDSDPVVPDGGHWRHPIQGRDWPTGHVSYASEGYLLRFCLGRGGQVVLVTPTRLRGRLAEEAAARVARLRAVDSSPG